MMKRPYSTGEIIDNWQSMCDDWEDVTEDTLWVRIYAKKVTE